MRRHVKILKAAADGDPLPSQQDANVKSSLVSGRRLLLLAGAASMASAVPRWVVQTLDSQHHRKLREDRIFSSFGASRAEAATLLDELKVVSLTLACQRLINLFPKYDDWACRGVAGADWRSTQYEMLAYRIYPGVSARTL